MNEVKEIKFSILFSAILGALVFAACDDDKDNKKNISYGPEVVVGNGKAKSFIKLDDEGLPTEVGFTFTEGALQNLPHEEAETFHLLPLPEEKSLTPFDHISFDWAPHGHEPATIYDTPHFDVHFYYVSESFRSEIVPGPEMEKLPEAKFLPANYIATPGEGVPGMGKHWVDATSPELHRSPFTHTFIHGSYNGEVIFQEPMITHNFLLSKPNITVDIKQPEAVKKSSNYPTKYTVKFNEERKEFTIALIDFVAK
jgi:hypothetical protein